MGYSGVTAATRERWAEDDRRREYQADADLDELIQEEHDAREYGFESVEEMREARAIGESDDWDSQHRHD